MGRYGHIFAESSASYFEYLSSQILLRGHGAWYENYFYLLIATSLLAWAIEIVFPWRRQQSVFRKDFWLDGFYMFFNFFLFSLVGFYGISNVASAMFSDLLGCFGRTNSTVLEIKSWPACTQILTLFVLTDFIHWNVHRLLHRIPWLWRFHKVHHSVKEMGFAAHLRFHWMESVIYKTAQFVPLSLIGFGISDFFIVHAIALLIGHLNHTNVSWDYGPGRWIVNNPAMHIWHHAKHWPEEHRYGMNFGLSLSLWDYVFRTVYVPTSGRDVELGFADDEGYPQTFLSQAIHPFLRR